MTSKSPRCCVHGLPHAKRQSIANLTTIHGDATRSHLPANSCAVVMLCEVLGEILDRAAVLAAASGGGGKPDSTDYRGYEILRQRLTDTGLPASSLVVNVSRLPSTCQ